MGGPAWGPRCEVGRRGGVPRKAREALLPETEASLQGRWQGPRPLGLSLQTTFPSAPSGRSGRHVVAPATPAGAPPQERCARMGGTGLRGQAGLQTRGGSPQDDCVLWGCGSPSPPAPDGVVRTPVSLSHRPARPGKGARGPGKDPARGEDAPLTFSEKLGSPNSPVARGDRGRETTPARLRD